VLQTPVRAPKANSVCERFGGTLRRECLDFFIPLRMSATCEKWLQKQRVPAKERSEWVFRAFWFIRAGGHMKIRLLQKMYLSEEPRSNK